FWCQRLCIVWSHAEDNERAGVSREPRPGCRAASLPRGSKDVPSKRSARVNRNSTAGHNRRVMFEFRCRWQRREKMPLQHFVSAGILALALSIVLPQTAMAGD